MSSKTKKPAKEAKKVEINDEESYESEHSQESYESEEYSDEDAPERTKKPAEVAQHQAFIKKRVVTYYYPTKKE